MNDVERIAIIDHIEHRVYVEDIDVKELNEKYKGEEEKYIKDNYDLELYSWDYITDVLYIPKKESDPIEIDFDDINNRAL